MRENTIVILWSDHGWKLGEYRGWGKMTNYEIDARVPLIISAPGMKTAGQDSESLVELLDLYPTVCELSGVDVPDFVEGKSLVPVLRESASRRSTGQQSVSTTGDTSRVSTSVTPYAPISIAIPNGETLRRVKIAEQELV